MFQILLFLFILPLIVARAPQIVPFSPRATIELDETFVLTCSLSRGSKPITFQWLQNGIRLSSDQSLNIESKLSSSTLTFTKIETKHSGNYSCLAQNSNGKDLSSIVLQVKGKILFFPFNFASYSRPICGAVFAVILFSKSFISSYFSGFVYISQFSLQNESFHFIIFVCFSLFKEFYKCWRFSKSCSICAKIESKSREFI